MQISQYIIVKKSARWKASTGYYSSRMTVGSPALDANEVAVKVSIELPDEIFDKPSFEAKVTVPQEAVSKPVITADVIDNVQDIIKQNTGFEVKLQIVEKDESVVKEG